MNKTYTEKQINDWRKYENVRVGGRFNMFDPNARLSTGLSREDYDFVMDNFSELKKLAQNPAQIDN